MDKIAKKTAAKAVFGCMLALSASLAYCGTMGPASVGPAGRTYLGIFGGFAGLTSTDIRQYATAFFIEAEGGPLAVNGFGRSSSDTTGVIGGHIGYAWNNITHLPLSPAMELEGYYIGRVIMAGHSYNDTDRLPEHDFAVTYPLKTGVFLVNAILNANESFGVFRPYIGVGIGSAVSSVTNARAIQISPPEIGVNHYSGDVNDRAFAFAAQPKVGFHLDFNRLSVFAEYRYLYISQTDYTFGSTVFPGHVATTPWLVKIKPQHYNMATIGVDFDL